MKLTAIFILPLLFILSGNTSGKIDNEADRIIVEGTSIGKINLGMKFSVAESLLHSKYHKKKWRKYSLEYRYKIPGLSIYTMQNDTSQTIFAIEIKPNTWEGTTQRGLNVNKELKVEDAVKIYGKPTWRYLKDGNELVVLYDSIGIQFTVDLPKRISFKTEANNDSIFSNNKISELTIGKVGADY
ncbi:MAG: hypothetical protein ACXVPU_08695 [Bacteroidia bacterium]